MSVQVRSGDLASLLGSLHVFSRRAVPGATSLKVARIIGAARGAFNDFQEVRKSLVLEYCKRDEAGQPISKQNEAGNEQSYEIIEEKLPEFAMRAEALDNDIVELSVKMLTENEIRAIDIEPGALAGMLQFIEQAADAE